ncbi:SUR7/PalI family-domain-containing protein [Phakopsora pachyrhizi]|nr:SUR7/PalI family-domain-containing protein [Phakopsora pachyrhizi]
MINPSTPGTLVVLAGSLLLSLSTLSTPVIKSIFFLSAKVDATVSSTKISGTLKLGTLGYCIELGSQLACSPLRFGYDISPGSIASLPQVTNLDIPTDLIKTLSYALILHPIAAGLALISAIVGFIAHFREYSQSCLTSFFTSLAATAAFLAFAFDIVAFNIAKSRIVDASTSSTRTEATLGKAIWITLGGWLCLAFSGVFFCVGRCVVRKKRFNQANSATLRPIADDMFASQMRQEALEAEEANKKSARKKNETSIPTFSEFGSEDVAHERIPLARFEESNEENRFSDHQPFRAHSEENNNNYRAADAHAPEVVGGFRPPSNLSRLNSIGVESNYTQNKYPSRRGTLTSNQPKPVGNMYNDLPPHVTPASNSMSASPQNFQLDDPQNLLSTEGSKQNFRAQLPGDDRYYIPSVSSQLSQNLMYPTYDRPKFPHYTEASSHHSEFRPEQSGDTYITGANLNRREQGYESHQNNVAESYGQFTPSQESHAQFHSQLPIAHNLVDDPYAAVRQPHGEFL